MQNKKAIYLALTSILLFTIALRIYPLSQFAVWGSDSGEYYFLTERLITQQRINYDYNGWGIVYPYFFGLYIFSANIVLLLNAETLYTFLIATPVISALSSILIFLITVKIFRDVRAGLLSALFLATAFPHAFEESRPMLGSLGGVLTLMCILLFLKSREDKKFYILLFLTTVGLIFTHHLSTYFLFVSVLGVVSLREFISKKSNWKTLKFEIIYIGFLFVSMLSYWVSIPPFRENIMAKEFPNPFIPIIFAIIGLFSLLLIVFLRRKFSWTYKIGFPSLRRMKITFSLLLIIIISIVFIALFIKIPGTEISLTKNSILLFTPFIILFSFTAIGSGFIEYNKNGLFIYGWVVGILASVVFSAMMNSHVLLSVRHFQYLTEPASILIGVGIVKFLDYVFIELKNVNEKIRKQKTIAFALITCLIILNSTSLYPPKEVMEGFQEGTYEKDIFAVVWTKNSLNDGTFATDHRMSSMLFGFGKFNASWDYAKYTLHGNTTQAIEEMKNVKIPSGNKRINYVFIDEDIKEGVILEHWEKVRPMSKEGVEKFNKSPFIKLYDNGFAQIYIVDYSVI